ncbi:MAG: hypothetical protein MZV65_41755 [Chromatiales bacterium]|nr:hypothetical protein [Chromatiales bacterium]
MNRVRCTAWIGSPRGPRQPSSWLKARKPPMRLAVLLPDCVHIASMNGAKSPKRSDWTPLAGRRVLIWPDADQPGADFARTAARLILGRWRAVGRDSGPVELGRGSARRMGRR